MGGGEIKNFGRVWLTVLVSLCYCYTISKRAPTGLKRLFTILPIICIFFALPLCLNSVHLCGNTAFFVSWLANFKLLLFAFGQGPLSSEPSISFNHFIAVGCLPIKIQQLPSPKINQNPQTSSGSESTLGYTIKVVLLAMLLRVYDYSEYIHPNVILILYCCHIYFFLEILLATTAAGARVLLGLELEKQFNQPYLSTSLQDFWGRRWNVMVTSILRPTVYDPTLHISTRLIGRRWASLPAVLSTFLVSGIMHELIFYYLGRMRPTWGITYFFLLNGLCLAVEIFVKKVINGRHRLHPLISGFMTVGFVTFTGLWLFVPPLLSCEADKKAFEEYAAVAMFVKKMVPAFTIGSWNST